MPKPYSQGSAPVFSCEFFPPRTAQAQATLAVELPKLMSLPFQLATCTNGACGSDPRGTVETLQQIRQASGATTLAAHLCCRGSTESELCTSLEGFKGTGVEWVVALRGDRESSRGFQHADQLVSLIAREFPEFGVVVAGYPESHPESESRESDLRFLKQKIDRGASAVFTQFFFDNRDFFEYRERCVKAGITVPIIPGILPVKSLDQVERLVQRCGAHLPDSLRDLLSKADDQEEAGFRFTLSQVRELLSQDAAGLHFYALNEAQFVGRLFEELLVAA